MAMSVLAVFCISQLLIKFSARRTWVPAVISLLVVGLLAGCGGGSDSSGSANTGSTSQPDKTPVQRQVVNPVTSVEQYDGELGEGYALICPAEVSSEDVQRFLITVPGFSPSRVNSEPGDGELDNACIGWPSDRNYHVVEARYKNGADAIQRNAGFVRALIEWLGQTYKLTSEDRIALVGYSMGGVVSRYALVEMEANSVDHMVDLFVTVDSPHKGAYIPIGVQQLGYAFRSFAPNSLAVADSFAARQMLRYHYSRGNSSRTWTDEFQNLYVTELQGAFADYPAANGLRAVAVASGRSDGEMEAPAPQQYLYRGTKTVSGSKVIARKAVDTTFCDVVFAKTTITVEVDILASARSLGSSPGSLVEVAATDVNGYIVIPDKGRVSVDSRSPIETYIKSRISTSGICPSSEVDKVVKYAVDEAIDAGKAQAANYTTDFDNKTFSTYGDGMHSEGAQGGRSDYTSSFNKQMTDAGFVSSVAYAGDHIFVALGSALGIDLPMTSNATLVDLSALSPFDQVYHEDSENLNHIESTSNWFAQEVRVLFDQ